MSDLPNQLGAYYVQSEDGQKQIFPLKHTNVKVKIAMSVSPLPATQTFENPFQESLEALMYSCIFTHSSANIKLGEQIDVTIHYTDSLKFEGGDYKFVFPIVVEPRYIPRSPLPLCY